MAKIAIVEDDRAAAELAEEFLAECGYEVCGIARTVDEAATLLFRHKPDLVMLDLQLGDARLGTELIARLARPSPTTSARS